MTSLSAEEWRSRSQAHAARAARFTRPYRERRSRGDVHPVYDFLFQYYPYSPAKLEAWHPAPDEALVDDPDARRRFRPPIYRAAEGLVRRDPSVLDRRQRGKMRRALEVLRETRKNSPNFGCYGVHEWAMVYGGDDVRHDGVARLRLSQERVDAFVESRPVACSHFDAFRFFAPAARPLNRLQPAPDRRYDLEQPGCIHANMDLYRWAYTAMPWIGSALLWECFTLAVDLREVDMRASPYDLHAWGFEPIAVETAEGRSVYRDLQQRLAARAATLRDRLVDALSGACLASASASVARPC